MNRFRKPWQRAFLTIVMFGIGLVAIFAIPTIAQEGATHWSYGGGGNPTQWGRLSPEFSLCEVGRDQSPIDISPIDIDEAIAGTPTQLDFNYTPTPLVVVNNGHTIQVNYEPGSTLSIDGEEYQLLQFHFHTPSEHTIAGKAFAMELHLVHRNTAGELAVVGVMLEEGETNPLIDTIWEHIPATGETHTVATLAIDASSLLPANKSYFSYSGSLTTPPCSENVRWNVLTEPIEISEEQILAFERLYQVNARPIQPTNGRRVELHER